MAFPSDITVGGGSALSLPGQSNLTGNRDTLLLAQYGGEVAKAYEQELVFAKTVTRFPVRGKSIQLPYFGRARAGFHTSMVNILDPANYLLSTVPGAQRFLYVDKPLVSAFLIDEWDDIINHLPTRQVYSEQAGRAIAVVMDNLISRQIYNGANVAADDIFTGHPGGNKVTTAIATDGYAYCGYDLAGTAVTTEDNAATALSSCIRRLRVQFDQKFVPMGRRYIAMSPRNYQVLCRNSELFDTDYTPGGNGSFADGEIRSVSGFKIVVSANGPFESNTFTMPSDGIMDLDLGGKEATYKASQVAGFGVAPVNTAIEAARTALQASMSTSNYSVPVTMSKIVALAWADKAVAIADARGLKVETDKKIEYGGTLVKTSVVSGCTYWHPEACGAILNP